MDELKFRTNIFCSNCVAAISQSLNAQQNITFWSVATDHKDKILTIQGQSLNEQLLIQLIQEVGFEIEPIHC